MQIANQTAQITNPDPDETTGKATVYFDGSCPLCTVEIDHYKKQSGAEAIDFIETNRARPANDPSQM